MKTTDRTSVVIDRPDPWLKSSEARVHLGISDITLRRWAKDGTLKPKRLPGGQFRFRRSDLDAVLA